MVRAPLHAASSDWYRNACHCGKGHTKIKDCFLVWKTCQFETWNRLQILCRQTKIDSLSLSEFERAFHKLSKHISIFDIRQFFALQFSFNSVVSNRKSRPRKAAPYAKDTVHKEHVSTLSSRAYTLPGVHFHTFFASIVNFESPKYYKLTVCLYTVKGQFKSKCSRQKSH